jgi:1,4-dihydroxy-2-naphthoate octaprenyltransferase
MGEDEEAVSGIACDTTGLITAYGRGAQKLFGWTADELIGKERVTIFHTPENVAALVPRLLKTAAETGVFEEEVTLVKKDGSRFRGRLRVRPLYRGKEIVGYMGITHPVEVAGSSGPTAPRLPVPLLAIRVLRAPFVQVTILSVLLGVVLAWRTFGVFDAALLGLTLAGTLALHLSTNVLNDYFDFKSGADLAVTHQNPFAGGGRVLTMGLVPPSVNFTLGIGLLLGGATIGAYLALIRGPFIWPLLVIALASAYFYVAPPVRFAHRGVGEFLVGLNFGPLMVLGTFYVLAQTVTLPAVLASMPIGLLVAGILWINEVPDVASDESVGKRTLVARLGQARAVEWHGILLATSYAMVVGSVITQMLPLSALLPLLTIPLAWRIVRVALRHHGDPHAVIPANALTILLHLLFGALLIAGVVLSVFV